MGNIAQDMARLADDIIRLKAERVEKIAEIAKKTVEIRVETNSILDEFAQTRKVQAKFDKANRVNFVTNLVGDVGEMLDVFQEKHQETAKTESAKRKQSVKNIKEEVHQQLDNFADEMSEMRNAWQGGKARKSQARSTVNPMVSVARKEVVMPPAVARVVTPVATRINSGDLLSVLADEFGAEMNHRSINSETPSRRRRR
jgi:hypothetical protein